MSKQYARLSSLGHLLLIHLNKHTVYYLAIASWLFTLAVYYPGFMSSDSISQLESAREGVTNNGNPPMMAYIWRVLDHIIPGPGGILILNTGLFWLALAAIAAAISHSSLIKSVLLVFCGFWPPIFGLIGIIWKDVGMHSFFLAALACSLHGNQKRRLRLLALSTIFLWLAGSYRYNAFVAAIPMVVLNSITAVPLLRARYPLQSACLAVRGLERACIVGGTIAICTGMSAGISFVNNYKVSEGRLWQTILLYDLAGISVCEGTNLLPEETTLKSGVTIEDLKKIYVGGHLGSIYNPEVRTLLGSPDPSSAAVVSTDISRESVFDRWLLEATDHPGCYLYHRSRVAASLLVTNTGRPWYPYQMGILPNRYGITFHPTPLSDRVLSLLPFFAYSTCLYSAWAYHVFLLLVVFAAWLLPFRHALEMCVVATSGLIYAATNLLFAASGDFRYNNWVIGCACLCVCFFFGGFRKSRAESRG
jgi:hypothetical protein